MDALVEGALERHGRIDLHAVATKVENLTRVLTIERARFGIRLTAVAAGHFATDTLMAKYGSRCGGRGRHVATGRLGTEEEFAWLVAYLASPAGDSSPARFSRSMARATTGSDHGRPAA